MSATDFEELQSLIGQVHALGWAVAEVHHSVVGTTVVFQREPEAQGFAGVEQVVTGGESETEALRNFLRSYKMDRLHSE